MSVTIRKSRSFAVLLLRGNLIEPHFLWLKSYAESGEELLHHEWMGLPPDEGWCLDTCIELLTMAGLTVRFYDSHERQWMDRSQLYGVVRAPGSRDGTWGLPDAQEFKDKYLAIL